MEEVEEGGVELVNLRYGLIGQYILTLASDKSQTRSL